MSNELIFGPQGEPIFTERPYEVILGPQGEPIMVPRDPENETTTVEEKA